MLPVTQFASCCPSWRSRELCQGRGWGGGNRHAVRGRVFQGAGWGHSSPGARTRAGRARVLAARGGGSGGAGSSLTRHRAERAEHTGRGGAESSAEQPLPATAADPGPRPGLALWTGARCCSLSRNRCVGKGVPAPPPPQPSIVGLSSQSPSPAPTLPSPFLHDLGPLPDTPGKGQPEQDAWGGGREGNCPQILALPFQDEQGENEVGRPLEAWQPGTSALAAPGTMWAQGPGPRVLGDCLSQLAWPSPLVCGLGPPSGLGRRPHPTPAAGP